MPMDELAGRRNAKHAVALRKGLNLSLSETGHLFGCGADMYAQYESGDASMPYALLLLCNLYQRKPHIADSLRKMVVP